MRPMDQRVSLGLQVKYVQISARSYDWANSIVFARHRELRRAGHESWVF